MPVVNAGSVPGNIRLSFIKIQAMDNDHILRAIQDTAKIGWWQANMNERMLTLSSYLVHLLGLESNRISFDDFNMFIDPSMKERIIGRIFDFAVPSGYYEDVFKMNSRYGEVWMRIKNGQHNYSESGELIIGGTLQYLDSYDQQGDEGISTRQLNALLGWQKTLTQTLLRLLNTPDSSRIIQEVLDTILENFDADRAYIFSFNRRTHTQSCIFESTREEVSKEIDMLQDIPADKTSWWNSQLLNGTPIFIDSLDQLPAVADEERLLLESQGIKSVMVVPLLSGDGVWGYMGVDIVKSPRLWTYLDKESFMAVSNVVGVCLELNRSEENAIKDREYLRNLYQNMPLGYIRLRISFDEDGFATDYEYLDTNPSFEEMCGHNRNNLIGRMHSDVGPLFTKPLNLSILAEVALTGKVFETEGVLRNNLHHYHTTIYSPELGDIVALFSDVTSTVRATEALKKSETELKKVYQNIPVGIEVYDRRGYMVDVNDRDIEIMGLGSKEAVLGSNLFSHPKLPEFAHDMLKEGKDVSFEVSFDSHDINSMDFYGAESTVNELKYLTVKCTVIYNSKGELENYLLIVIDNTEILATTQKLREFETIFNSIAEFAEVGFFRWEPGKQHFFGSDQWFKNMGLAQIPEMQKNMIFGTMHPDDVVPMKQYLEDAVAGKATLFKSEIRVKDGDDWKWLRAMCRVSKYDPENNDIQIVGLNDNITELKAIESNLLEAKTKAEESDRLKSSFLANMSHEIRTPLNAIVGFSNLLTETDDVDEKLQYISIIQKNNDQLLQLISDILDLSKIEAGILDIAMTDIDVNGFCEQVVSSLQLRVSEGVEMRFLSPDSNVMILSDRNRLTQLLSNFLTNAIKFTSKGHIWAGYEIKGEEIEFYVKDTGMGMSPDQVRTIFGRFIKLNHYIPGTGLGLSICKSIVEKLGGRIGVESELGVGSRFWFTLPYTSREAPSELMPAKEESAATGKPAAMPTVLVAEDTDSNYVLISIIMRKQFNLLRAKTGTEALEMYLEHSPDLILMDVKMPEIDGLTVARAIRETDRKTPIIALTAFAFDQDRQDALDAGCNDYMTKPIVADDLKAMINKYLKQD